MPESLSLSSQQRPSTERHQPEHAPLSDPLYYLHNFRWLLDWVVSRHGALLMPDERVFVSSFGLLPTASQGLFVRMVMRKGELFRSDKLRYRELGNTAAAVDPLIDRGWVEPSPELELDELFRLFTWPELRSLLAQPMAQAGIRAARKGEAQQAMTQLGLAPRTLTQWGETGTYVRDTKVYCLKLMPLCHRLRVMFFGNAHQDWSEFVLTELGLYQYEPVEFSEQSRPFTTRAEIDTYLQLHACRERFYAAATLEPEMLTQLVSDLPGLPSNNPWLVRSRDRLLFNIARQWERIGQLRPAEQLYSQCNFAGARARHVRVLELQEKLEQAMHLAQLAFDNPESEAERQSLLRLLPRLSRKLKRPKPMAQKPSAKIEQLNLTLPHALPVELAVKVHLESDVAPVYYVENGLITGLFALLCWEAIFAPIPGAFFHPFQSGPADLHWPDFYQRRAHLFDTSLGKLSTGEYRSAILVNFEEKYGRQCPFMHWAALTPQLLNYALECIPAHHLRAMFQRLLADIKAHRTGLPDLIQFWPGEHRYRLIEVKAPGDRVQDNQKSWLEFFAVQQIPAWVCHVRWQAEPL